MPMLQKRHVRKGIALWCILFHVYQILVVGSEQSWDHAPNISGKLRCIRRSGMKSATEYDFIENKSSR
jgi:hypothetical protein